MNKMQYFIQACKAGLYKKRSWVFSAFTLVQESMDEWKKDAHPYRLVQTANGCFFVHPESLELEKLDDTKGGEPPFKLMQGIDLKAGEFENVSQDMRVSLGNLIFNLCSIIPAFGKKMDFVQGSVSVSKLEQQIANRLESTPEEGVKRDDSKFYVDEYLRFCNSFGYLTEFNQICTWALTPKAITQAPGTKELRSKLVKENQATLDDPITVAKIEAELIKHDKEYLQGDPSENFLLSAKSRNVARKKLFLDYGADAGLTTSYKVDMIQSSLSEGWETDKMPQMINASRAGSYDRGAETQLGGEAVKWLYRAASNVNIIDKDCGSRLGIAVTVTPESLNKLVKMRIITQTSTTLIEDEQQAGQYLGKRLMVRSPMYCKLGMTDYCRYCVGERLGNNPNSGATAISKLGSNFLSLSLKKFHSSELKLVKAQLTNIIS